MKSLLKYFKKYFYPLACSWCKATTYLELLSVLSPRIPLPRYICPSTEKKKFLCQSLKTDLGWVFQRIFLFLFSTCSSDLNTYSMNPEVFIDILNNLISTLWCNHARISSRQSIYNYKLTHQLTLTCTHNLHCYQYIPLHHMNLLSEIYCW